MCDYSLHLVASRPATVGDKLVTTKFRNSTTRGFAAVGQPNVAVCLLPGTEVAFDEEVEREHAFGRLLPTMRFGKLGEKVGRFRQINMNNPDVHHDALEFPNGRIVLITRLCEDSVPPCCSCRPHIGPLPTASSRLKINALLAPKGLDEQDVGRSPNRGLVASTERIRDLPGDFRCCPDGRQEQLAG
jgi:hypothetical protein